MKSLDLQHIVGLFLAAIPSVVVGARDLNGTDLAPTAPTLLYADGGHQR